MLTASTSSAKQWQLVCDGAVKWLCESASDDPPLSGWRRVGQSNFGVSVRAPAGGDEIPLSQTVTLPNTTSPVSANDSVFIVKWSTVNIGVNPHAGEPRRVCVCMP